MYLSAFAENRVRVANIAHYFAWIVGGLSQLVLVWLRVVTLVCSVVPGNIQFLATLKRRPGVVRDYRDSSEGLKPGRTLEWINRNNLTHTCDLQCCLMVIRFHFAAEDRRTLHGGVHHAVCASIHPVDSFSGHQRCEVVAYFPFPDISPRALCFELQIFSFWDR